MALVLLGVVGVVLVGLEVALVAAGPDSALVRFGYPINAVVYLAAGLYAWARRPVSHLGPILAFGGFAWLAAGLTNTSVEALIVLGTILATLFESVVVHIMHVFPTGRVEGRLSRITVAMAYAIGLIGQIPLYIFVAAPYPYGALTISNHPHWANLGSQAQRVAGTAVVIATAVLAANRLLRITPQQRRVLAPLWLYGTLAVLTISSIGYEVTRAAGLVALLIVIVVVSSRSRNITPEQRRVLGRLWLYGIASVLTLLGIDEFVRLTVGFNQNTVNWVQLVIMGSLPLAFLWAVKRGGFSRVGDAASLATWLGESSQSSMSLRDALASTLGDPTLQLVYWSAESQTFLDADGRPFIPPAEDSARAVRRVEVSGHLVGGLVYERALNEDLGLVAATARLAAIAVDRERLVVELLASRAGERAAATRVVVAGDRERERIARDLHDGLQSRLIVLALQAGQLASEAHEPGAARRSAERLRVNLLEAANELRDLVHGVMPAPLIEGGLAAAVLDLVDRLPIPTYVQTDLGPDRLNPTVEASAYLVVAEAITNSIKHARPSRIDVRLADNAGCLSITIIDDGPGGATVRADGGLAGLADRLATLRGSLVIDSSAAGTSIIAKLPTTVAA
jgi:signal transduction histidine kinase